MRARLAPLRAADRGIAPQRESADVLDRLRSLGYVSAGPSPAKERYTEDDDPKRLIELDALLREVRGLYLEGNVKAALERCRELVRRRPQMAVSLLYLAHIEREAGNLPAGVSALERALAVNPGDTTTLSLLGAYLTQAGRAGEAVALLSGPAQRPEPDPEVLRSLALALGRLGRGKEAVATLARAREVDPQNVQLLVDLGTIRLMAGEAGPAREAFEAALAQNPGVARAHSSLGFMDAQIGRRRARARAPEEGPRPRPPRVRDAARARVARLPPGRSGRGTPVPRAVRRVGRAHAVCGERRPGPRVARGRLPALTRRAHGGRG